MLARFRRLLHFLRRYEATTMERPDIISMPARIQSATTRTYEVIHWLVSLVSELIPPASLKVGGLVGVDGVLLVRVCARSGVVGGARGERPNTGLLNR